MTLVTQGGDPALWSAIYTKWLAEGQQGWVVYSGTHYEVSYNTADVVQFDPKTTKDLVDSRSLTGPAASYTEIEIE